MNPSLRQLLVVAVVATATVLGSDAALRRVCPLLPRRIEAGDGIAAVRDGNPETLLLGSSHSRSFIGLAERLDHDSAGTRQLIPVAMEYGKLSSYQWLLDHRLRPYLDARKPDGTLVRDRLRRFILVTEWWDHCTDEVGAIATNVPARAWGLSDFLDDVFHQGLTSFNLNYVDSVTRELFGWSILYQDRGVGRIHPALMATVRKPPDHSALDAARIAGWQRAIERGATDPRCHDGVQRAALLGILDWAQGRGLDTTLLLFTRHPDTLSDKAKATTLANFSADMAALAAARRIRFLDFTLGTPLRGSDFMSDLDHVSREGNRTLSAYMLEHGLGFVLEPPAPGPGQAGPPR